MSKKEIVIQLSNGLEARPVAMLVQVASQFDSEIHVISGQRTVISGQWPEGEWVVSSSSMKKS